MACAGPGHLCETAAERRPDERLLQHVWLHQRLRRDELRTTDGRSVLVLHPGFWNREAGPDFRQAMIQFGDQPPQTGDIEVDLAPGGWTQHRHQANAAYARVILHVVWDAATPPAGPLPTLALRTFLDAPLTELESWLGGLNVTDLPPALRGACALPLARLAAQGFGEMLRQAAAVRLELKAARLQSRARQAGWEQALWEGIFVTLGYKHNVWPMRRLAELLPRLRGGGGEGGSETRAPLSAPRLQGRLLGVAGLLPTDLRRSPGAANAYLRAIWDGWWRERDAFREDLIPRELWRFHGLRPANHPARRLALAAHWLAQGNWLDAIEAWLAEEIPDRHLPGTLLDRWRVPADEFWTWHWTLGSARLAQPRPLLGRQRVTDLAMNVVLPWLWSRARAGGNEALATRVEHRYFVWPAAQDNAVLRLACQRLLGGGSLPRPRRAADQQGLLQIVRDFCDQANALCEPCPFPDLVRRSAGGAPSEGVI